MGDNWTEVKIEIPVKYTDTVSNIANMAIPYGIYIEDYSNLEEEVFEIAKIDMIDEELLQFDRSKAWVHIYVSEGDNPSEAVSFMESRLRDENIPYKISTAGCSYDDWMNNWKKYFKPLKVGHKMIIRPSWEKDYDVGDRLVLNLDPGVAFGTGTHETTKLCMELIEKYIKKGDSFLDVGCGSGILSVAALLLGADNATAVDIDPLAVKTAKENAKLNGLDKLMCVKQGDLTDKVGGKFDVIAANIVADIIIDLNTTIDKFMNADSVYITSGIIDAREQDVRDAVMEKFEIIECREENGWIAMVMRRRGVI